MKHLGMPWLALLTTSVFPLILTAGCPVDPTFASLSPIQAGMYWVDYRDGALVVFELPDQRGTAGVWSTLETAKPAWYTGPALYEIREDGSWDRLTSDETLTLDDVMQTYDPAPSVGPASS